MLAYLSRYTHRVAIANSRLIACDRTGVTFRWKDYRADGRDRQKVMTLAAGEFIRRFLIHVLPQGFHRIRHYGLFASGTRADNIARARRLLDASMTQASTADTTTSSETREPKPLSHLCPCCGSHDHHRDIPARFLAALPARGSHRRVQDRHIMIRPGSRRHSSAALLLRRLSTSDDHARRRAALDNRLVDQSSLRDAGSAYRGWPTEPATLSTASQRGGQRTSATHRQRRNPHSV